MHLATPLLRAIDPPKGGVWEGLGGPLGGSGAPLGPCGRPRSLGETPAPPIYAINKETTHERR